MKQVITNINDGLPHFLLEGQRVQSAGFELSFRYEGCFPEPFFKSGRSYEMCILGNPILGEVINKEGVAQLVSGQWKLKDLQRINGEFLIFYHDKQQNSLQIINDRFSSIPLFYFVDEQGLFRASVYYADLWKENQLWPHKNAYAFFEFMWLQKLLGENTFDTKSRFLKSASVLKFEGKTAEIETYWQPSFEKSGASVSELANELANALKHSIKLKTSDNPLSCIFLSGGLDSRSVLAAFPGRPVCFTLANSKNVEYQVASRLAAIKGAEHRYLQIPEDKYSQIYKKSVRLGGGMYAYDHALFLDYGDKVTPHADVAFHGHGFDYMFQGMYVPINLIQIFGRSSHIPRLRKIEGDPVEFFIRNIPYRLKYVNLLDYVKRELREEYFDRLYKSAAEIIDHSQIEFYSGYDVYEYLITHSLSRHYANTNISSLATYMEQRTISFENGIFDLFYKTPVEFRVGGKIARQALKFLNKDLGNVITANLKIRAVASPYEKTLIWLLDNFWKQIRKLLGSEMMYNENDRTWPVRDVAIQSEVELRNSVLNAAGSEQLSELGFLDMDKIRSDIDFWFGTEEGKRANGGAFMTSLITINEFIGIN